MLIVLWFSFVEMANKFLKFKPIEWDYQARYDILQTRPEETPKQACSENLEVVGQLNQYNTLVTGPLRVALGTKLHLVHECAGEVLSISFTQFGVNVGLLTEEASVEEENTGGLREFPNNMRQMAWAQIGEGPYDPSVTKSSQLWEPLYRYIHRVLSNSLCQRCDSTGFVSLRDLTVLYCIHNRIPLGVTHLLLRNIHLNQLASSPTLIFFGGWIYRLFKTYVQRHIWNLEEALVLHVDPTCPPPQYQGYQTGSSSQGGGFPNFQRLHDLLQENLLCTRNTYNMASNTFTRIGSVERAVFAMQDDITYIRDHMVYRGEEGDEDEHMD
ncbi:hypothetical protein Hanom_Chr10g00895471 [Helianthus anomalus]